MYIRWGKQTLGGHKQKFVCTRTQEKAAVTPQETDPDLPRSVWWRHGWPDAESGALSVAVPAPDLLKQVPLSSLSPPQFGLRSNNREGMQPHPSTENWI